MPSVACLLGLTWRPTRQPKAPSAGPPCPQPAPHAVVDVRRTAGSKVISGGKSCTRAPHRVSPTVAQDSTLTQVACSGKALVVASVVLLASGVRRPNGRLFWRVAPGGWAAASVDEWRPQSGLRSVCRRRPAAQSKSQGKVLGGRGGSGRDERGAGRTRPAGGQDREGGQQKRSNRRRATGGQ